MKKAYFYGVITRPLTEFLVVSLKPIRPLVDEKLENKDMVVGFFSATDLEEKQPLIFEKLEIYSWATILPQLHKKGVLKDITNNHLVFRKIENG